MIDQFFIFGAKYLFVLSFVVAGIYFLIQPRAVQKKILIFAVISLPLIYVASLIAGALYDNPRPFVVENFVPLVPHEADNGFPSDHTLIASAIAAVFMCFSRRIAALLWLIAIVVGISRVYVGAHHPVDVIASMFIAVVVASVVSVILKRLYADHS